MSAYTNAELLANNININTQETTNIIGATIQADDTLNLSTKNLNVASVQDSYKEKTRSTGASIGGSGAGVSSIGANQSKLDTRVKETVLTSLTGANVNIDVQEDTTLKGATIAAVDAEGNDNGNLNLSTGTLTVSSLNNTVNAKSVSANVTVGGDIKETDANNISLDYSNDSTNTKTKTLATLGSGTINIANTEDSDTKMLNRDVANNEIDIYDVESHQGFQGELDTRLLSEDGRNQIKEDLLKSGMIVDTVKLIVTTERVGVEDFFSETDKSHTTYEAVKDKIAKTPELAEALNNPDLTPAQKEVMLDAVTDAVMTELGYTAHDNKLVSTDETGQNGEEIKGFYSLQTNDAYINDKTNDSTVDLVTTAGHEAAHAMDSQDGIDITQHREDNNIYADNYGENLASYTDFALAITGQGSMAATNTRNSGQVTTTPSVFNDNTYEENNAEFAGLDKELGDDRQLHQDEIKFIEDTVGNFKLNNKDKTLTGRDIEYSDAQVERLLMTAAQYMVDETSQSHYNDNAEYVSANEFTRDELQTAIDYLKETSEGKQFLDIYDESMNVQNFFTATVEQFNNSDYQPGITKGLDDDSLIIFPATRVGTTVIDTTAIVGRATYLKVDDVILNTGIKTDNFIQNTAVPAVKDGYYRSVNIVLDPENIIKAVGSAEIVNDIVNDSTPASTSYGQAINTVRNISEIIEKKLNDE